jgi:hypothetical protein
VAAVKVGWAVEVKGGVRTDGERVGETDSVELEEVEGEAAVAAMAAVKGAVGVFVGFPQAHWEGTRAEAARETASKGGEVGGEVQKD